MGFTENDAVFETLMDGLSFHDTVWNWLSGAQPQVVVKNLQRSAETGGEVSGVSAPS